MKVLVVYFSRSGHTRELAERLARRLRATLMPITERQTRAGAAGYVRSLLDELDEHDPVVDARIEEFVASLRLAVALPARSAAVPARAA